MRARSIAVAAAVATSLLAASTACSSSTVTARTTSSPTTASPTTAPTKTAPTKTGAAPPRMYVAVTVATVWTDPSKARAVDRPALTNPAYPRRWLRAMTSAQSADLSASNRTQTQVLYGAPVLVLGHRGAWSRVAVPGQPTPRDSRGYPGWIPTVQLTRSSSYAATAARAPFALLDRQVATGLFADRALRHRVLTLSMGTRLPVLGRTLHALLVATPDRGSAWLPRSRASVYRSVAAIPRPTGRQLVRTARTFLRQPYVWAGRSSFGVDCSGLTGLVYQVHGLTIPRDAGPQAQDARARRVAAAGLRLGDLLFYSHSSRAAEIYHVAMYVGSGQMIEAYNHLTPVRITAVRLGSTYWGAVRYPHR